MTCPVTHIRLHLKNDIYTYIFQISLVYICICMYILYWYDATHITCRVTHIRPHLKKYARIYMCFFEISFVCICIYFTLYDATHIACPVTHIKPDPKKYVCIYIYISVFVGMYMYIFHISFISSFLVASIYVHTYMYAMYQNFYVIEVLTHSIRFGTDMPFSCWNSQSFHLYLGGAPRLTTQAM